MSPPLAKHEVEQLMALLNEEQRAFLEEHSKQSKKSKWIESLARRKGIVLDPDLSYEEMGALVDDWILVDILDSGLGNRNYHCECGRPLRYQYLVHHKKVDKTYGLGSKCSPTMDAGMAIEGLNKLEVTIFRQIGRAHV